jgi:hypothetical protein
MTLAPLGQTRCAGVLKRIIDAAVRKTVYHAGGTARLASKKVEPQMHTEENICMDPRASVVSILRLETEKGR